MKTGWLKGASSYLQMMDQWALAVGCFLDTGVVVPITTADPTSSSNINFGYRSILGKISGTIIEDVDGDGIATSADLPKVGVEVFVDANRNGILDDGEVVTQTDDSGGYQIDGLAAGDHAIRTVAGVDERANANAAQTRLFAADSLSAGPTIIREHDPITGQELRSFAAPTSATGPIGLAIDSNGLYVVSDGGLWILDPDSGSTIGFVELPDAPYTGAAAVGWPRVRSYA